MAEPTQALSALTGRYRVEREIGAGGMATVYLARDLRHDRDVALKVLRPELGAAIGAERFLTEIRTVARLQHPHILPLLDSGEIDGTPFYVMPYVTGETLRSRLARERQFSIDEAIRIAREVADALQYAHAAGIIHRDIKPENILLQSGHALVADFGIALAVEQAGGQRLTQTGLSLGTPQYMSPEQAMGERVIDARSDIYSLGAVTYEMLTGDPPFTGTTMQAIVAKVLTERPTPLITVRDTVPPGLQHAVLKALAKLPADRYATAPEFAAALELDTAPFVNERAVPSQARALARARMTSVAIGAIAVVATLVAVRGWTRSSPPGPVQRLELTMAGDLRFAFPLSGAITDLAISPDGQSAVFSVERGSGWVFAVRSLDRLTPRILPGTEGGIYPEFSPDGQSIAFETADGRLKKIGIDGSNLSTLCSIGPEGSAGITWISGREIVYAPGTFTAIGMYRCPAEGGAATVFTHVDSAAGERYQVAPRSAAQGRLVFYGSPTVSATDMILGVVRVRDGSVKRFPDVRVSRVLGLVDHFLVYVRVDGSLMAAPFDEGSLAIGAPVQVGDSIAARSWDGAAAIAQNGSLLYQQGGAAGQLVRVDVDGRATVLIDSARAYVHPRLSPDGRRIAFEITNPAGSDIWVCDLASGALTRLTNGGVNDRPEWSPDGQRVLFASGDTPASLWSRPADGSAEATREFAATESIREGMFTPDGQAIVYRVDARKTNRDIWMVPLHGDRTPVPLLNSMNDEKEPRVSPDGKWLAYVSNESGREEVYMRSLASGGGRVPVSARGGGEPLWGPDGRHLYYRASDGLVEATIATTPALSVSARRTMFAGPYATDIYHPNFDIARDGKSFVMVRPAGESRRMVIVMNWVEELRRRLGESR